jgi:hypothetical protein
MLLIIIIIIIIIFFFIMLLMCFFVYFTATYVCVRFMFDTPVTSHEYYMEVKSPMRFENFYKNSRGNWLFCGSTVHGNW